MSGVRDSLEVEQEGNALIEQYQLLEAEQQKLEKSITALRSQILENQTVKEELDTLEDDAEVFKALGPVLVKMELQDAKATVKQRLDRLESEVLRLDSKFKEKEEEKKKLMGTITKMQEELRTLKQREAGAQEE